MTATTNKVRSMRIGCDNLVWFPLITDDGTTLTYGEPVPLPGLMKVGISTNSDSGTAFYDNGPGETAATLGNIEVTIDKNAISTTEQAILLGHTVLDNGVVVSAANDTPPEGALAYRTLKGNGKYMYVCLLKGSFSEPDEETETKGDSVNFQNSSIVGNFSKVNKKFTVSGKTVQPWRTNADEEDEGSAAIIKKWFESPVLPDTTAEE